MRTTRLVLVMLLLVLLATSFGGASAKEPKIVDVQILAFNDFHGNLEPPSGSSGRVAIPVGTVNAGGAVFLATHIKDLEAVNPNTILVSGGDLIGASPLLSALFHDEPTIEMANLMGMDLETVGNHEFDEGWHELQRMQKGGCHPVDGCQDGDPFDGFDGKFLSANVTEGKKDKTLFPSYRVLSVGGAKVAFIGVGYENTPSIVIPSGVEGLKFLPEVSTVNQVIEKFKHKGVKNFVVLMHDGGSQTGFYNECVNPTGTFFDYVNQLDPAVSVVISAHSHYAYNCLIGGKVVTQAMSNGRILTDIDLTIDAHSGEIITVAANNEIVTRDVTPDPDVMALITKYNAVAKPIACKVVGSITADITRTANAAGESAVGDVLADGQLYDTAPVDRGGAVMAFTNPGGIRADLMYITLCDAEAPGEITYGEAFAVQPFSNNLVTMDLQGTYIHDMLEQQWMGGNSGINAKVLQVSNGFTYDYSASGTPGDRVDPASIKLNGVPIDPAATYRLTANIFLAGGGDNFPAFTHGTNRLVGGMDLDALTAYLGANSPVPPGPMNRIVSLP